MQVECSKADVIKPLAHTVAASREILPLQGGPAEIGDGTGSIWMGLLMIAQSLRISYHSKRVE